MALPHYTEEAFLRAAEQRYQGFLGLINLHPGAFLVPCYDVDLLWHTHQARRTLCMHYTCCSSIV